MVNYFIGYYFIFVNLLFFTAFAFVALEFLRLHKKTKFINAKLNRMKEKHQKADMEIIKSMDYAIEFLHQQNS